TRRSSDLVEPRAGDLGAAFHIDGIQLLSQLQVVQRLEPFGLEVANGTYVLDDSEVIFAAGWDAVDDQVRDRALQCGALGSGRVRLCLGRLDRSSELLDLGKQGGAFIALGLADLLGERILLGTQALVGSNGFTTRRVSCQQLVN